jgi:predicted  nucleic acid-binding Zn-ribbon protein
VKSERSSLKRAVKTLEEALQETSQKLANAEEHISQTTKLDKQTETYYLNEIDNLARENTALEARVSDLTLVVEGLRAGSSYVTPDRNTNAPPDDESGSLVHNLG